MLGSPCCGDEQLLSATYRLIPAPPFIRRPSTGLERHVALFAACMLVHLPVPGARLVAYGRDRQQ